MVTSYIHRRDPGKPRNFQNDSSHHLKCHLQLKAKDRAWGELVLGRLPGKTE